MRQHRHFFLAVTLAGLALRLFFFFHYPAITDDSRVYADFATNLMQHGIYGRTVNDQIVPADSRLPEYPLFLAAIFAVFGTGNFRAVLLVQIVLDLITCLIIADLARRTVSDRASRIAFALSALCPFLANYAAAALTETLKILFTSLALDCAVAGLQSLDPRDSPVPPVSPVVNAFRRPSLHSIVRPKLMPWIGTGLAIGAAILLRPDGGILLASMGLYLLIVLVKRWGDQKRAVFEAGVATLLAALITLSPWTIRNFLTLHRFQPLAPRYATEQDELAPRGFNRWVRTWIAEYTSVEEIYWDVPGNPIDATKLPDRAFDSPEQKEQTLALIADYNAQSDLNPQLDARFGQLAAERVANHPIRYYAGRPLLRIADMWLRPRTELLPPDPRWWEFNDLVSSSVMSIALGIVNLAYIALAACAILKYRQVRYLGLLLLFVALRSAFLGSLENPEPRYTLECYPVVIVLAASAITHARHTSFRHNLS